MNSTDIAYMSATELIAAYRARALSPVEVTESILRRVERLDPTLNAFAISTPELAIEAARRAESAYAAGAAGPSAWLDTGSR